MPDVTAARVIIPVKTNAKSATADLNQLDGSLNKLGGSVDKNSAAFTRTQKSVAKTGKSFGSLKKIIATVGIIALVRQVAKLTDAYANVTNKLKLVTSGTKDLQETQKRLFDLSQKSRSSFESTAELYARLSRSTRELNVSTDDLFTVTDAINKAFIVSGASAEESSNAIRQLSQGLAAGALRGDEFNSVAEQAPRLQEAIAASLGVTVGELRALAAQGKITSEVIVTALKGQADVINDEFKQLTPTIGQVAQTMQNTMVQLGGSLGERILPDIAILGQAFVALAKDGGVLLEGLSAILKVVTTVAKSFALLGAIIESISTKHKFENTVEDQQKALKVLSSSLQSARNEFGILAKTRPQIVKALEDIAKSQDKVNTSFADKKGAERAAQLLDRIKEQGEVLNRVRDDTGGFLERNAEIHKVILSLTKQATDASKKNIESQAAQLQVQKKRTVAVKDTADALKLMEAAGDPAAFLANQRKAFSEQRQIVAKAGLDVATLEKFQQSQRLNQFDQFFKGVTNNQMLSLSERQTEMQTALATILEAENLSNGERLAAQEAFNQQSAALEQQRFQAIANGVQTGIGILGDFNSIAQSFAQIRQNNIQEEIDTLEAQGASEEEIAEKRAQLQRKAAKDQKRFATFAAILDTASAVASALTVKPFPLGLALSVVAAAKGIAQVAAIRSQPIPAAQFGGSFEVAPGNEADSGLLQVNQGETVDVTPAGESGGSQDNKKQTLVIGDQEFEGFLTNSMQRILNSGKVTINRTGVVRSA